MTKPPASATAHDLYTGPDTAARGLDVTALDHYLTDVLTEPSAAPITAELISGGKSNLTYRVTDGVRHWILRRPPLGHVFAGAHDVGREYRVMNALKDTAVPVPGMVLNCTDPTVIGAPFYLMDAVPGTVLRTRDLVDTVSATDRRRLGEALVDTLVTLHEVAPSEVGLSELGRPAGYLRRQLDRWTRQYQQIKVRDLHHIDDIVRALSETLPHNPVTSIVHGDFRIDNVIVDPEDPARILAVLDWEMATLGDPLADLGILVSFWDEPGKPFNPITSGLTAFPGFPTADEVIQRYAQRRDVAVDSIDWYRVFAQFKLAVILEQIYVRHLDGQTRGQGFDTVGTMVATLINTAYEIISKSPAFRRSTA